LQSGVQVRQKCFMMLGKRARKGDIQSHLFSHRNFTFAPLTLLFSSTFKPMLGQVILEKSSQLQYNCKSNFSLSPSVHTPIICLSVCIFMHLSVSLSIHTSVCQSVLSYIYLAVCLFIQLSVTLSIYTTAFSIIVICLSVHPGKPN